MYHRIKMNIFLKNKFFIIITISIFFYPKIVFSFNEISSQDCYQKISYPSKMFGQFQSKTNKSIREIQRIFVFGKNKIQEKPSDMLFGLSYLELIINQLCEQMHDSQAIMNRIKIEKIVIDLRKSFGIPDDMQRSKVINIYWSTGKLLNLAKVEKLTIDEERQKNIKLLRKAKSQLRMSIMSYKDENF